MIGPCGMQALRLSSSPSQTGQACHRHHVPLSTPIERSSSGPRTIESSALLYDPLRDRDPQYITNSSLFSYTSCDCRLRRQRLPVLASVLKTLNERYSYGLNMVLLSMHEGIKITLGSFRLPGKDWLVEKAEPTSCKFK